MPLDTDDEQIASLRGAEPRPVDARRLRNVVVGVCTVALLALSVTFFVAGAQRNNSVTDLARHGVRVTVTVTACTGQLGGSGSNAAGYSCRGFFTFDAKRYESNLADNLSHGAGERVVEITPSDNPGHLTTVSAWRADRASWHVFIVPTVLGVVGLVVAGLLIRSIRSRRPAGV